jgi:hypothetical protein
MQVTDKERIEALEKFNELAMAQIEMQNKSILKWEETVNYLVSILNSFNNQSLKG